MRFDDMRDRVLAIYEERERLAAEERRLVDELRERCSHPAVIETPQREVWSDGGPAAQAPLRLCLTCAYEESGWPFRALLRSAVVRRDVPLLEFCSYRKLRPLEAERPVAAEASVTVRVPKEFAP